MRVLGKKQPFQLGPMIAADLLDNTHSGGR
jgi:hypothetical protein